MCVGELLEEREAGKTMSCCQTGQGRPCGLSSDDIARIIIAYEPVWAIGTGKTATPAQAEEVHKAFGFDCSHCRHAGGVGMRILYGGSVKADNVDVLMSQADIDGALVGGAA